MRMKPEYEPGDREQYGRDGAELLLACLVLGVAIGVAIFVLCLFL